MYSMNSGQLVAFVALILHLLWNLVRVADLTRRVREIERHLKDTEDA